MACDTKHDTVLRVGFLNSNNCENKLQQYQETFDIVIADDGSLCPVLYLLEQLFDASRELQINEIDGSDALKLIAGDL